MKKDKRFVAVVWLIVILSVGLSCGIFQSPQGNVSEETNTPTDQASSSDDKSADSSTAVKFDISTANQIAPNDILQEIAYYGQGGGGPEFYCDGDGKSGPTVTPRKLEWMEPLKFLICWWHTEDDVLVAVIDPNLTSVKVKVYMSKSATPVNTPAAIFEIPRTPDMPVGMYQIVMNGDGGLVATSPVEIYMPDEPRIYGLDNNQLILYNFASNENIRLLAYSAGSPSKFLGWNQYQVDGSGKLYINISGNSLKYYAVGEQSGAVMNQLDIKGGRNSDVIVQECGGLKSRLLPGDRATVTKEHGLNYLRPWPLEGKSKTIDTGIFTILNSRQCIDNNTWWYVSHESGEKGWVKEDMDGVYLLQPVDIGNIPVQIADQSTVSPITPTAQAINSPSALLNSVNLQFDLSKANQVAPENILEEISYYGQGGGYDGFYCYKEGSSETSLMPAGIEWMAPFVFMVCGWKKEEVVLVTIVFPDNTATTKEEAMSMSATPGGTPAIIYEIPRAPSPLVGKYQITVDGPSGHFETQFEVFMPSEPRLYNIDDRQLVLYNFTSNENIKLLAYSLDVPAKLLGWQQYQVDDSGKLFINIYDAELEYYVVGEKSGQVPNSLSKKAPLGSDAAIQSCGGLETRLSPGDHVIVPTDVGANYLRDWPFQGNPVTILGGEMTVLDGHLCRQGSNWWYVRHDNGKNGWILEDQNGQYLLEPVK